MSRRKASVIRTAGVIAFALISVAAIADDQHQLPVALLLDCKCTVKIGDDPKAVDPRNMPLLLYPDQKIKCEGGSAVVEYDRIVFPQKARESCVPGKLYVVSKPPGAFVPGAPKPLGVLSDYIIGGRSKGSELAIYAPADGGSVAADRFVMRWTTKPDIGTFVAVLIDPAGKEIARSPNLKGTEGTTDSQPFRQAIANSLAATPASGKFQLVLMLDEGGEQVSSFNVLTKAQQSDIDRELASAGNENSLLSHIERAGIFDNHRLYNDVAAEYDKAIAQAPGSVTLLRAAVGVNAKIGDLERARNYTARAQRAEQQ
jgi:hypothetical protein